MNELVAQLDNVLGEYQPQRIWVGFSGGVDSTALLLACHQLLKASAEPIPVGALHVNHGLHGDAAAWQAHCSQVCAQLGIELVAESVEVQQAGNLEAAARKARYEVFAAHVGADELLLLGHHQQDQTETVLYRLFQGRGVVPMRAQGSLGSGYFVRPLLSIDRGKLTEFVGQQGVPWIEDSSNADTRFTRNFLRHDVLPTLASRWPSLHSAVARVASRHSATQAALQHVLSRLPNVVDIAELPTDSISRQAWLRAYLHSRSVYSVSDKALADFTDQLLSDSHSHVRCGSADLHAYAGQLYFEPGSEDHSQGKDPLDNQTLLLGHQLTNDQGTLSLQPAQPTDVLAFIYPGPLNVCFRKGGERIRTGHTKTLKQIFNAAQIPPWRRRNYPLLYHNNELTCVPNLAVAQERGQTPFLEKGSDPIQFCVAVWVPH